MPNTKSALSPNPSPVETGEGCKTKHRGQARSYRGRCQPTQTPGIKKRAQMRALVLLKSNDQRGSLIKPLTIDTQPTNSTMVNGNPVDTAMACKDTSPPPSNRAMAITPSIITQNTRCGTGALTLPPAVMVSITSEPESDEVTKNTITSTMPINELSSANGSSASMANSFSSSAASCTPVKPSPTS